MITFMEGEKVKNQLQNIKILISMKNYNLNTLRCN